MAGEPSAPSAPPSVTAPRQIGANQLRALFGAIESRYGHHAASEIWLEVFGEFDGTAQT